MNFNSLAIASLIAFGLGANAEPPKNAGSAHEPVKTVTVGGAPMFNNKNIIENAVNSKDHTSLVEGVKAAGLVETLKGPGPFTVFAPDNKAFEKIPKPTLEALMKPEGKANLSKILTYHVIAGKFDSHAIAAEIKKGKGKMKGKATFKTVAGGMLTASMDGSILILTDEMGGTSRATIIDVYQSNGVIHSVDTVLMPK